MATITVEDGTRVAGANSYVTTAEFTTYCGNRNITIDAVTYGDESELLIKAMDYLEQQDFKGWKVARDQALQFPRVDLWIDGYDIDSDVVPQILKDAQCEIAVQIMQGYNPLRVIDRAVKREKVDVIEVEYMDNAATQTISPSIANALRKLLRGSVGGNSFSLVRA